jgi:capsid protein
MERQVLCECVVAGDHGAVKHRPTGRLQLIEAERITAGTNSSRVEQGVELTTEGRPLAYWVSDYSQGGGGSPAANYRRFDARDFLYVHSPFKRPSQTRAMPVLQSSFPMLHRINDVLDAEAIAWQLLSRFAVAITKRDASAIPGIIGEADTQNSSDTSGHDISTRVQDFQAGIAFWGDEPGEEIKGIEQNRPPENFEKGLLAFLRLMCMPLGIPLEIWLIQWGQMNLSSARASLLQFYQSTAAAWQSLYTRLFHRRIYRWKVAGWVSQGLLPERPDILDHAWLSVPYPWLDPEQESKAWGVKLDRMLCTQADAVGSDGRALDEVRDARACEIIAAAKTADGIERVIGRQIPGLTEHLAGMQMGKTQAAAREKSGQAVQPAPAADEPPGDDSPSQED